MPSNGPESVKAIGERLRLTRLALGYPTQTAIGRRVAPDDPFYLQKWNNWERGRERIGIPQPFTIS